MTNQIIHKGRIRLLASGLIVLGALLCSSSNGVVVVAAASGATEPLLDLTKGQSSKRLGLWIKTTTTTAAPDVAPAPASIHKLYEQSSSATATAPAATREPSTRLGKGNKYDVVPIEQGTPSSPVTESPGLYRIVPHALESDAGPTAMTTVAMPSSSESTEDAEDILETFINSRPDLTNNLDIITQAFRYVKLDAHLGALVNQLTKLQQSHEELQGMTVKQETKFDILAQEMKSLANSLSSESAKLKEVEDRIESEMTTMNQKLESAVEKIIKSSTVSQFLTDMSKESLQQLDKVESLTEKVLGEIKSVQTELGDVGQASIQAVYNVQKTEENLMTAMAAMENRTIYALRQESPLGTEDESSSRSSTSTIHSRNASNGSSSMMADAQKLSLSLPSGSSSATSSKEEAETYEGSGLSCYPASPRYKKGHPMDCSELRISQSDGMSSGVYTIYPFGDTSRNIDVFCDMETDGGGWTVIQRRSDQQEIPRKNFFRPWSEYEKGFGSPLDHVWLGLSPLAELTAVGDQELKIELMDWDGNERFAKYGYFRVANGTDRYRLHIADYSGNAGDSMAYHNGMPFSTKDMDNDLERTVNCAQKYHGAWWYKNCHQANLNGQYMDKGGKHVSYAVGINWYSWHGYYYSLKKSEMKIRNRHFKDSLEKKIQVK